MKYTNSVVNGESEPGAKRARRGEKPLPPNVNETYSEAFARLTVSEKMLVRRLVKGLDINGQLTGRQRTAAIDALGRATVRQAILSVAPYLESHLTARLVRPYVLAQLVKRSMSGDAQAAKLLLSLPVQATKSLPVNYTKRSSSAPPRSALRGSVTTRDVTAGDVTDSDVDGP